MRQRFRRRGPALLIAVVLAVLALITGASPGSAATTQHKTDSGLLTNWPMGGGNYANSRSNPFEQTISPANVADLAVKWAFTTHGDISASAAVVAGAVYFPDWGGYLNKVNAATGKLIWQTQISSYTGTAGDTSRTSPTVMNGIVYIGDRDGAHLMAISAATGRLLWTTELDSHPAATLTSSPIVFGGIVYEGVSSQEQAFAENPTYPCCTFRGSMTATNALTGARIWKTYTIPDNGGVPGYSGGAIWGGTPTLDLAHGTLFASAGNNYSLPQSVVDCENSGQSASQCLAPDDRIDSVVAFNMFTGSIEWSTGAGIFDTWNLACVTGPPPNNCPQDPGGDYDFGDGSHLFWITGANGVPEEVVGAGSKSGVFWAIDAVTGKVLWSSAPAPGSFYGGIMWGSSVDGSRIYVAEANYLKGTVTLPNGSTTTGSTWAALDPATGKVLWQVPDPSGGVAWSPLTSANGVLYASSTSGYMYALDAASGATLWSYQAPYSVNAGPDIVGNTVYWGDGYANGATGSHTTGTFYAFSLGGH